MTKRMACGSKGVGVVEELLADFSLRVIIVRNRGRENLVPWENVAEMEL